MESRNPKNEGFSLVDRQTDQIVERPDMVAMGMVAEVQINASLNRTLHPEAQKILNKFLWGVFCLVSSMK